MLTSLKLLLTAIVGVALGLAATYAAVGHGVNFTTIQAGPWAVDAGGDDSDPYLRADLASRAEIPVGLGEGLSFVASTDSAGAPLSGRCDYIVAPEVPAARYWSLSAMTAQGRLIENQARRYGFTSAEIVRSTNGDFTIEISALARPGNWLPLGPRARRFVLVLRLYDTPVAASVNTLGADDMPGITRKGCA